MTCPQKAWTDRLSKARIVAGTALFLGLMVFGNAGLGANGQAKDDLTSGLMAFYPFNGNANDASGNGNNATVRGNGLTLTTDRFDNPNAAYHFDFSSFMVAPRSASLEPPSALTISAWVQPDRVIAPQGQTVILTKRIDAHAAPWNSYILVLGERGQAMFCLTTSGIQTCIEDIAALKPNAWTHVAGTYDGAAMRLFVNGRLVVSGPKSGTIQYSDLGLLIGATPYPAERFLGKIDDVRIYNRALSDSEVLQLFSLQSAPLVTTASSQERAASSETGSAEEALGRARNLRQEGKLDEALKAFDRAVKLQPNNEAALMEQFTLLAEMNVPADALKVLDKLIALNPNEPQRWGRKAMFAAEAGRVEEALNASEKMTQLQPSDIIGWLLKGQCLVGLKRNEEALRAVDKAITLNPIEEDAWRTRIVVEPSLKEYDSSITFVSKLVKQHPTCLGAVYDRAGLYALKGDKAKALADLKSAITLRSDVKPFARKDERFKNLWNDPDFKKLTE